MFVFYTVITALTSIVMFSLMVLTYENNRLDGVKKQKFYYTYCFLMLSAWAEWGGAALNGAPLWTIPIHNVVKCIDYILTPAIALFFINILSSNKRLMKVAWGMIVVNVVVQILSFFTGWTYYINRENYYEHGDYHFIYILVYCVALVLVVYTFLDYGKSFKRNNRLSLVIIVLTTGCGIASQEIIGSGVRTSNLALTFAVLLLFIHYSEFAQLKSDDVMSIQRKMLETDTLTGLYSRYAYSERLNELEHNVEDNLVVFEFDINGLKTANDTIGHEAGDEMICAAANFIGTVFSKYGKCYRTGGDEFVALLTMTQDDAQKAKRELQEMTKGWQGEKASELSIAVGYAFAKDFSEHTIIKLVNEADQMMYQDKKRYYIQTGKDRRKM